MSSVLDQFGDGKPQSAKLALGVISRVSGLEVYVTVPSFALSHDFGPIRFAGSLAPAVGDKVLVGFDEKGLPWIVSWTPSGTDTDLVVDSLTFIVSEAMHADVQPGGLGNGDVKLELRGGDTMNFMANEWPYLILTPRTNSGSGMLFASRAAGVGEYTDAWEIYVNNGTAEDDALRVYSDNALRDTLRFVVGGGAGGGQIKFMGPLGGTDFGSISYAGDGYVQADENFIAAGALVLNSELFKSNASFFINTVGGLDWGPGDWSRDAHLYRTGVGALKLESDLEITDDLTVDGDLTVLGTVSTPGAPPIGSMLDYTGTTDPADTSWLLADGRAVLRASYPTYHSMQAAAGYPYGNGNGTTTFNLPDSRGRGTVGPDNMGTAQGAASRMASNNTLGAAGGAETLALAIGNMPAHDHGTNTGTQSASHTHTGTSGGASAGHTHVVTHDHTLQMSASTGSASAPARGGGTITDAGGGGAGAPVKNASPTSGGQSADHTHTTTTGNQSASHTHAITSQGSGTAFNKMGPYLVANKIVRVK